MKEVVIGTRGSVLALWQANFIKDELAKLGVESRLKIIKTTGDKILDAPLAKIGGKGLFTKELEEQILNDEITLAVHSLKDVPVLLPSGLILSSITKREYEKDCFLSYQFKDLLSLPQNAKVGTTSLRRAMQIKSMRKDLQALSLRGNVQTRLAKLKNGEFDAIILAEAALKRLNITGDLTKGDSSDFNNFSDSTNADSAKSDSAIDSTMFIKTLDFMIPAFGQGALGIECKENCEILEILQTLNDAKTQIECEAEREFVRLCDGGCQVPIGVNARLEGRILKIRAILGLPNGEKILKESVSGDIFPKNLGEILQSLLQNPQNLTQIPLHIEQKSPQNLLLETSEILLNAKNLARDLYKVMESNGGKELLNQALVMLEDYFG